MFVLGISAFHHDSAAALVEDGRICAAAQEERFSRKKHDPDFPSQAIAYCLEEAGITLAQVDHVIFYDKPFTKFERFIETYLTYAPRGFASFRKALPAWLKEKLFQKNLIRDKLRDLLPDFDSGRLLFSEHHLSHAASAFYPSPFQRAAVLTMDGMGGRTTTSQAIGDGKNLQILREIHYPHSLGLLYSTFTYYAGFKVNSGEYKLMGLAPYGTPRFVQTILDNLVDVKEDGSFRLNQDYFDDNTGLRMTNRRFDRLFGGPPRPMEEALTQREMDIAASIQVVLEDIVLRLTRSLAAETGERNLCLAGGVALNCVANGKILRDGHFDNIWIQPASGDSGGALGAALAAAHLLKAVPRQADGRTDSMKGSYLGPSYSSLDIQRRLTAAGAKFVVIDDESALMERTAKTLAEGLAVGWHQGRMEFGPRALGGRSILGDPRSLTMQRLLNLKVKYRESFRPFAPAVLREHLSEWFEIDSDSPYMLMVAPVASARRLPIPPEQRDLFGIDRLNLPRSEIPAVTHVDYSARIQTVHHDTNPRFHALISAFYRQTGCPVLVNTSFNVRGEPIVSTPEDAFRCFMGTEIEALVVGNCFLQKEDQDESLRISYKETFELD